MDERRFHDTPQKTDEDVNLCLYTFVHEPRNPLIAAHAFAYVSILIDDFRKYLPQAGRKYLERIDVNIRQARSLLEEVGHLSPAAVDESRFIKVGANTLIDFALQAHVIQLERKQFDPTIQDDWPDLCCDPRAIWTIFSNLIGNAIKYARHRSAGKINIGWKADDPFHKFLVRTPALASVLAT